MSGAIMIDPVVFARLVGSASASDVLLFEVAREFVGQSDDNAWSEPVRFRFVRREGAKVELEIHPLGDPEVGEDA